MSDQQLIEKKINTVINLIITVYKEHLRRVWIETEKGTGVLKPRVIFKHKSDQTFCIIFIVSDTWPVIKRKMNKLIESDGVCVVCFEQDIYEKVRLQCDNKDCKCNLHENLPRADSLYCLDCCEMLCLKCFEKMKTEDCPVCRKSFVEAYKRYYGDE